MEPNSIMYLRLTPVCFIEPHRCTSSINPLENDSDNFFAAIYNLPCLEILITNLLKMEGAVFTNKFEPFYPSHHLHLLTHSNRKIVPIRHQNSDNNKRQKCFLLGRLLPNICLNRMDMADSVRNRPLPKSLFLTIWVFLSLPSFHFHINYPKVV